MYNQIELEQWKELQHQIEYLEDLLTDFGVLEDSFADENDFQRLAKGMIGDILDELEATRKGWDAHVAWMDNKLARK